MDKQKLQEARKEMNLPRKSRPLNDVQAVLDLPDSPKVKLERDRKEIAAAAEANQKETQQMIDDIRQRQERDKQLLLEEHNKRLAGRKTKQEERNEKIEQMESKLAETVARPEPAEDEPQDEEPNEAGPENEADPDELRDDMRQCLAGGFKLLEDPK